MEKLKNSLKLFFKTPMLLVFVFITIFYGGMALGKDAEVDTYAVVTAIGLDKTEDGKISLSLLTFVPIVTQNFAEQYEVVVAEGQSLAETFDFAGLHLGREIGLSHTKLVVVNDDYFESDVSVELDFLVRNKNLAMSTSIIATDAKANEFLNVIKSFDSGTSIKADDLLKFNEDYIYSFESTFESFYKGLYSPTKSAMVTFLSLVGEDEEGIAIQTSQGEQGGESGSQQGQTKKKILNDGQAILCREGKKVAQIDKEMMKKINLIKGNYNYGSIVIENFTDELFQNARLTFEIFDNVTTMRAGFSNGVPVIYLDVKLLVKLSEAREYDLEIKENVDFKNISKKAIKELEFKVKNAISDGVQLMREHKCDLAEVYTKLNNTNSSKWQEFQKNLSDKDEFLNFVVFKVSPQIFSN